MDVERTMVAACGPEELYVHVVDLASYPAWMDLVHEAVPEPAPACGPDSNVAPAWDVELRAQLGPLARSKRLRMERTVDDAPLRVVFERRELDGRQHAEWRLEALLAALGERTQLTMRLHYGGRLWTGGVLERVLEDRIERGSEALRRLVESA